MAHGGSAVARIGGKAYFVDGVIPGELATGEIELDKGSWGRIRLDQVVEPSPDRVQPSCRHFSECGGCQWQHAAYKTQLEWKRSIVAGQLKHLGGISDPPVRPTVASGDAYGYRNRMEYRVRRGMPALHRRRSRSLVPIAECGILHPNISDLFPDLGNLAGVEALTLRTSVASGEVLAVVKGKIPPQAETWACNVAQIVDGEVRANRGSAALEEVVAGCSFRITGTAFFQNNTAGAERLVQLVAEAAETESGDTVLDAYAGGGLFAVTLGSHAARVVAVEINATAAADLQANLNRARIADYRIIRGPTEEVIERIDEYWDVAVADPPRRGLGVDGIDALTAARPRTLVYVSCDPASLARDSGLLHNIGYQLDWVTPVDMFPQTFHIECVARYRRTD